MRMREWCDAFFDQTHFDELFLSSEIPNGFTNSAAPAPPSLVDVFLQLLQLSNCSFKTNRSAV